MFKDLVVVEFSSVLAGPLVGSFFAELGAKVYKIENKKTEGDITRKWRLPSESTEKSISAYYASANYGKQVIMADLTQKNEYDEVVELVRVSDIVIVNCGAKSARKLAIDYDIIKSINPKIIYASLTGYGENVDRPAYDMVLQAETGYISMTGSEDGPPCKIPIAMIDVLAAHHLKEAVLCALLRLYKLGEGSFVSVSLYDAAIASLVNQATNYLMNGHVPRRMGSRHPNIAPYGDIFSTKDSVSLALAIGTDYQFENFAKALKIDGKNFETNKQRLKNRELLCKTIQRVFSNYMCDALIVIFESMNIPFCRIKTIEEVFNEPEARMRLLTSEIEGTLTIRPKTAYI